MTAGRCFDCAQHDSGETAGRRDKSTSLRGAFAQQNKQKRSLTFTAPPRFLTRGTWYSVSNVNNGVENSKQLGAVSKLKNINRKGRKGISQSTVSQKSQQPLQ